MPLLSSCLQTAVRGLGAFFIFFAIAGTVRADAVEGLYEATRPVADQSLEQRQEAIRSAFVEVLARISGRTGLEKEVTLPAVATAIERATRYVQQYRYGRNPDAKSSEDPQQTLWVEFDPRAIKSLLRDNGLPVWGQTRPATLIWLALDEGRDRKLISNDSDHPAREILLEQAKQRGLPVRLPFLDLTDRSALRVTDVWGNFEDRISRASERYETEAVLVGRAYKTRSGLWQARWTLYEGNQRNDWSVSGPQLNEVLVPGIDQTTRAMAIRYADMGLNDSMQLLLRVSEIKGLADYNRVLQYLETLSPVTEVQPYSLNGAEAVFSLQARSGRPGVMQAIALGHVLVRESSAEGPANGQPLSASPDQVQPDMAYRLVP